MMLGLDSTTQYATGNFTRPLTVSQLHSRSPYNTRTHVGLPPTPIDNPGLASMQAAAHPAQHQLPVLLRQAVRARQRVRHQLHAVPGARPALPAKALLSAPAAAPARGSLGAGATPRRGRLAGRPQPLAARSRTPRLRAAGPLGLALSAAAGRAGAARRAGHGAARRAVPRSQRDDPPQAGGAGARHRGRLRARGRSEPPTRSSSSPGGRSSPTTPTRRR